MLAALLLAACSKSSSPPAPPPPAGPIVIGVAPWQLQASDGMSVVTTPMAFVGPSWTLAVPTAPPGLHYVTTPVAGRLGGALNAQYHVARDPGALFAGVQDCPGSATGPVAVLYFQEAGDNWSGAGVYASYRWWAAPTPLNGADSGTISVAIDPSLWTGVQGQHDPVGFGQAASNVGAVGITLGDGCSFGHGIYMSGGNATIVMDRFWVQ